MNKPLKPIQKMQVRYMLKNGNVACMPCVEKHIEPDAFCANRPQNRSGMLKDNPPVYAELTPYDFTCSICRRTSLMVLPYGRIQ